MKILKTILFKLYSKYNSTEIFSNRVILNRHGGWLEIRAFMKLVEQEVEKHSSLVTLVFKL